jgi:hypothetical protein
MFNQYQRCFPDSGQHPQRCVRTVFQNVLNNAGKVSFGFVLPDDPHDRACQAAL